MRMEDAEKGLYRYRALCESIVDGDTLDLNIDLGLRVHSWLRVRLLGLNTPEIYGVKKEGEEFQKGLDAAKEVVRLLRPRSLGHRLNQLIDSYVCVEEPAPLWVETIKDKTGKYGRFLVRVWVCQGAGTLYLNEHLINEGFAEKVAY